MPPTEEGDVASESAGKAEGRRGETPPDTDWPDMMSGGGDAAGQSGSGHRSQAARLSSQQ